MLNSNIIFTFLLVIITNTQQQQQNGIPPIACPNYFQYFHDGSNYFGRISLPNVGDNIDLSLNFSQRALLRMENYGQIIPESKEPLKYRVEFFTPNEVPKLTKITLNGQDICFAENYPAPCINFYLNHQITRIITPNQPPTSFRPETFTQISHQPQSDKQDVVSFIPLRNISPQTSFRPETFTQISLQPQPVTEDGIIFKSLSDILPIRHPNMLERQPLFQMNIQPVQQVKQSPQKVPQVSPRLNVSSTERSLMEPVSQYGQCGEETAITGFVVGGEELAPGEFPWLTAIYQTKDSSLLFHCGGSLIAPRTVLSAGHCVKRHNLSAAQLLVHLGRHNLGDFSDESYVTRNIKKIIIHPDYKSDTFPDADLAILQLQSSVQYTTYIRPICLWSESSDLNRIVGKTGVIAGWGADGTGRSSTAIPKKIDSNIVSESECRSSSATYNSIVSRRTFCAGNRDGDGPCMGDSGSGLMIYRNDRWYLRGIVSAGQMKQHTCDLYHYVVFCDVAKHLEWIQSQIVS